jgi:hypothetical protein
MSGRINDEHRVLSHTETGGCQCPTSYDVVSVGSGQAGRYGRVIRVISPIPGAGSAG